MFNMSLFYKFKTIIESTFGEYFFQIDPYETSKKALESNGIEFDRNVYKYFNEKEYCRDTRWDAGVEYYTDDYGHLRPISDGGQCTPFDSSFVCVLKPLAIPTGETIVLRIGVIGSKYYYSLFEDYYKIYLLNNLSDVLKEDSFKTYLRLKSTEYDEGESSDLLLSPDDVEFLYSLKGHKKYEKFSLGAAERIKRIGLRFPKENYQYLYRGIRNETFYREIESSFETSCDNSSASEEVLLSKDLSDKAKKYFSVLASGVRSWTPKKKLAVDYAEAERPGGYVLLIWVNPPIKDIALDVDPTLLYIQDHREIYNKALKNFEYYEEYQAWARSPEVLAEPKNARIVGIKRWSQGLIPGVYYYPLPKWPCNYVVYLKS